jgi:pyrroloquinoline quinone biosynthesis protein A
MRPAASAGTLTFSYRRSVSQQARYPRHQPWRLSMMIWETPAATDLRFGFEITMYIANR